MSVTINPNVPNLSGNRAGIQGHSQGPVFPVVESQIGTGENRKLVSTAFGVTIVASSESEQRANSLKLLELERLADLAVDSIVATDGFSLRLFDKKLVAYGSPGYFASYAGFESINPAVLVNADGKVVRHLPYNAIVAYIRNILDIGLDIRSNVYIGGWVNNGKLYLDVSLGFADSDQGRADCIKFAQENGQLAYYDGRNCVSVDVPAA